MNSWFRDEKTQTGGLMVFLIKNKFKNIITLALFHKDDGSNARR